MIMQKLSTTDFKNIVKHTPLVSIDLIMINPSGKVLLGMRNNNPARGYWFVPGGRIHKDEYFEKAFERIVRVETGQIIKLRDSEFAGVYQHIYPGENFSNDPAFGTHYIVIAFRIRLKKDIQKLPKEQHSEYRWASVEEILNDPVVHRNTKNYFNGYPALSGNQPWK
jgi:colanic acid biosynthesis protein WcaH